MSRCAEFLQISSRTPRALVTASISDDSVIRKTFERISSKSKNNGFADRCTEETAYSTGTESVGRTLEVLVNQYDWPRGPLTFRVVKRLKFSALGLVGITLG